MEILAGFAVLAFTAASLAWHHYGIEVVERKIARWLLADARGWQARSEEKTRAITELEAVR